jgi:hypothetical protein
MERVPLHPGCARISGRPKAAYCGDLEEWLLLKDELLLLPAPSSPLGTLPSLLHLYFSERMPWPKEIAKV